MTKKVVEWTEKRLDRSRYEYASRDQRQRMLQSFVTNTRQGQGYAAVIPVIMQYIEKDWNLGRFDKDLDRFRRQATKSERLREMEQLREGIKSYKVPVDLEKSKENILKDLERRETTAKEILPTIERTVVIGDVKYELRHYPIKVEAAGWRENVREWYRVTPSGRREFVKGSEIERLEREEREE